MLGGESNQGGDRGHRSWERGRAFAKPAPCPSTDSCPGSSRCWVGEACCCWPGHCVRDHASWNNGCCRSARPRAGRSPVHGCWWRCCWSCRRRKKARVDESHRWRPEHDGRPLCRAPCHRFLPVEGRSRAERNVCGGSFDVIAGIACLYLEERP
jgi:hypothetical protein